MKGKDKVKDIQADVVAVTNTLNKKFVTITTQERMAFLVEAEVRSELRNAISNLEKILKELKKL